jgi:hypothetical protein
MADTKISALTGASTPLAGTEVLPIVQSNATVKVSIANVTAGRAVSALSYNSTVATGTAPFTVASTTNVANLNASSLSGATFAAPGTIGGTTPAAGNFSSLKSSANVAAGNTTASSWATIRAFQVDKVAFSGVNSELHANGNAYYSGGWKYIGTGEATQYAQGDVAARTHQWQSAISGSADGAISWIEQMRIDGAGIVTMPAYGVGTATFSAAGVISSVSDETWKIKDGVPVDTDSMIKKLQPGYWFYNDEKKEIFGKDRQLGFYAQNVNAAIGPEAAPEPEEGKPWGYYDRSVLAVAIMSLQKALETIDSLVSSVNALEAKCP